MYRKGLGVFHNKIVKVDAPLNLEPGRDVVVWDLDDYMVFMAFFDYIGKRLDIQMDQEKDDYKEIHNLAFNSIKNSDKASSRINKRSGFKSSNS